MTTISEPTTAQAGRELRTVRTSSWLVPLMLCLVPLPLVALAMSRPATAVLVIAAGLGIQLLAISFQRVTRGLLRREASIASRVEGAVLGFFCGLAGVLCLSGVSQTAPLLTGTPGLVWIIAGLLEITDTMTDGTFAGSLSEGRISPGLAFGSCAVLVGTAMLLCPGIPIEAKALMLGIWLVLYGFIAVNSTVRLFDSRYRTERVSE